MFWGGRGGFGPYVTGWMVTTGGSTLAISHSRFYHTTMKATAGITYSNPRPPSVPSPHTGPLYSAPSMPCVRV